LRVPGGILNAGVANGGDGRGAADQKQKGRQL
jgi:hypothetical protein